MPTPTFPAFDRNGKPITMTVPTDTDTAAAPDAETAAIEAIAARYLDLETLETRSADALDFSEQAVWQLRAALKAAYRAGQHKSTMDAYAALGVEVER